MGVPPRASAPLSSPPSSPPPPWSPPLAHTSSSSTTTAPPGYEPWQQQQPSSLDVYPHANWRKGDPRSSSTQSLVPSLRDDEDERRILLVVYIHGFMGNNTSFQSFPAHVHNYLKDALAESHVIHSKVYPRYKTYKAIEVARDNLSKWLEPHESVKTDVVLVGHSMGGLLVADLALMPSPNPVYGGPFKHRILGTISLDAPLLGLHPGIVKSGLQSLFRKAPEPPGKQQQQQPQGLADSQASQHAASSVSLDDRPSFSTDGGTSFSSGVTSPMALTATSSHASGEPSRWPDPNFNPAYFNDVPFVDRGWWRNVAHFAKKHYSEGIFTSAYQHLLSHLEFGGCLADYSGLKSRYERLRRLEDVDELNHHGGSGRREPRVRFVNYYTVSTGIPKEQPPPPAAATADADADADSPAVTPPKRSDTHLKPIPTADRPSSGPQSGTSTPRISIEDYSDNENIQPLQVLDPVPEPDSDFEDKPANLPKPGDSNEHDISQKEEGDPESNPPGDDLENDGLPAIPTLSEPPTAPDFERYTDKDSRKQAEKEFKRVQKTYDQAVKNREKAIKERAKLVEKRRKKAAKEVEKTAKEAEKKAKEEEKRMKKEEEARRKAAGAKGESKEGEKEENDGDDDDGEVAATAAREETKTSQAQVLTPAQMQVLDAQLTDLALQDSSTSSQLSPHATNDAATTTTTTTERGGKQKEKGNKNHHSKPAKLRKFCVVPPKNKDGLRDSTWVQVYMEGVDEVGAHCGLFFPGPHYEKLVGDVGGRIVGWTQEDLTRRTILGIK